MLLRGRVYLTEHVADLRAQDARYAGHGGQGGIDLAGLDFGDVLLRKTGRLGEGRLRQLSLVTCLPEPFAEAGLEVRPGAVYL